MQPRRSNRRRGEQAGSVVRRVNARLRALHLTGAGTWFLRGNQQTAAPPPYNEDAIWQRKVRFAFQTITPASALTFANVLTELGLAAGTFGFIQVQHIAVWGNPAVAGNTADGIRVQTYITNPGVPSIPDREFSDFGTAGAERACIKLSVNLKDLGFSSLPTDTLVEVSSLNALGVEITGGVIVDMTVLLKNTAAIVRRERDFARFITANHETST